ncbi:MAG: hypothetical protein ACKVOR_04600 [Flavobacteriales bacterium]
MNYILRILLPAICMLPCSYSTIAQDTLLLMNGQQLLCSIKSDTSLVILMEVTKKNGKVKVREIHKSDIFSVTKAGEKETVLYTQNEMFGDIFTEEEMRIYLAGEGDARSNYDTKHIFIIGVAVCFAISFSNGDGYITSLAPPLIYTLIQLIGKLQIPAETIRDEKYRYNDFYAYGYEPPARSRKLFSALKGGFMGSALGVIVWYLFNAK